MNRETTPAGEKGGTVTDVKAELLGEIDKNYTFFQSKLPQLLEHHRNRFALLRHQEIVGIYDTVRDAKVTGDKFFSDGLFSIQQIEGEALNLGYFSHAVHLGAA
jgi:hypothetical protein